MNDIINKFLLAGDNFIPEMHLRQPRFVYSAFGPFTRHKVRIKESTRTGDTSYIYRNELDKRRFKHDAAYAKYKDVENRLIADDKLQNTAYDIAIIPEYDGYQRSLASMIYKFFNSKVASKTVSVKAIKSNKILAEELHKAAIKKFNKKKYIHNSKIIYGE